VLIRKFRTNALLTRAFASYDTAGCDANAWGGCTGWMRGQVSQARVILVQSQMHTVARVARLPGANANAWVQDVSANDDDATVRGTSAIANDATKCKCKC